MSDCDSFAAYLLARRIVSPEQIAEVWHLCQLNGARFENALLQLGYVDPVTLARAKAAWLGWPFLDLNEVTIPPALLELMPESVARENLVLPLMREGRSLTVVLAEPDPDTLGKLVFILDLEVRPVLSTREQIIEAIDRHYGETETESVDSMLAEFTDTAIDFTRTEATLGELTRKLDESEGVNQDEGGIVFDIVDWEDSRAPAFDVALMATRTVQRPISRRATVRYYHRMNPQRLFPMLVILSKEQVREVAKRGVGQAQSQNFIVAEDSFVEVEPILPGCACFPPRDRIQVKGGEVSATFWVAPEVLGAVHDARVVVSQDGQTLATVPLQMHVVRQSLTRLVGALSLVMPFGLLLLKHFRLDFESQKEDGFSLYAHLAGLLIRSLTPEVLTVLLVSATVGLYFWLRPRRREVFWDIQTNEPTAELARVVSAERPASVRASAPHSANVSNHDGDGEDERLKADLLASEDLHAEALLGLAGRREQSGDLSGALALLESALDANLGKPELYLRAAEVARKLQQSKRALAILHRAEKELSEGELTGPLWFALGCCAAKLGRFPDAIRYLNRAVDAGFDDVKAYEAETALEPLRWNKRFQGLMQELSR